MLVSGPYVYLRDPQAVVFVGVPAELGLGVLPTIHTDGDEPRQLRWLSGSHTPSLFYHSDESAVGKFARLRFCRANQTQQKFTRSARN